MSQFAKPKIKWKKKWVPTTVITWSGTDTQASRQIEFEIPWNPFDKGFNRWKMAKGDVVELWFEESDHAWFTGTITEREKTDKIGTARFVAKDYMHHLLRSTGTYIFKKTTPEAITKKVCGDVAVKTTKLTKTGINIKKMIFEGACLYDIIVKAYRKVKSETKKNYLPIMLENKLTVIEKGNDSGVVLTQGVNITSATYKDNVDNMVDLVKIFNDKHKKVGEVKNDKNLQTYGVYQQTYQKESGVSATKAAKAMLYGTTREATVEAFGDIRAMSGFSITIKDPATGLDGKFFIVSDEHKFEKDTHIMTLGLAWKDTMEEGADTWKKQETSSGGYSGGSYGGGGGTQQIKFNDTWLAKNAKEQANKQYAYYVEAVTGYGYMGQKVYAQTCYHSTSGCSVMKKEKKKYKTGTFYSKQVGAIKKMRAIIKAPQKYGAAHKCCSCCWKSGQYGELVAKATKVKQGSSPSANQGTSGVRRSGIDPYSDPRYR